MAALMVDQLLRDMELINIHLDYVETEPGTTLPAYEDLRQDTKVSGLGPPPVYDRRSFLGTVNATYSTQSSLVHRQKIMSYKSMFFLDDMD